MSDKERILSILKGHGTYVGQKWTFKPIDLTEAAAELESILPIPSIPTHYGDVPASDQTDMVGAEEVLKELNGGSYKFQYGVNDCLTAMYRYASIQVEKVRKELEYKDISINDLRKLFAHRASRIADDLNQGANQLMTLTDFRLAIKDMGWRIGFDKIARLESDLSAAKSRIAKQDEQLESLLGIINPELKIK